VLKFRRSGSKNINKSLGFRLTEEVNIPDLSDNKELQDHLFLKSYIGNILGSLQFYSEVGQLMDGDEHNVTIDIGVGEIGMLDFTPNQEDAAGPIWTAFWDTLLQLKGKKRPDSPNPIVDLGKSILSALKGENEYLKELAPHIEELDKLIGQLPPSKEAVSQGKSTTE